MACDNLCGFKKNGWHDTACPESDDSRYGKNKVFDTHTAPPVELDGSSVMCRDGIWALLRTKDRSSKKWVRISDYPFLADTPIEGCEKMESTIKILRGALVAIDNHPTNGNSDPDSMAEALEQIHALAEAALEAAKQGA